MNSHRETPLHVACFAGIKENVQFLLSRKANIFIQSLQGETCLDYCLKRSKNREIASLLMEDWPIALQVPVLSLCRVAQVCSKFKRLSEDDKIWKEICQISLPDTYLRGSLSWKEQCRLYYEGEQDLSLFPNITLKGWRKSNTNRQPDEILKILLVGDSNCSKSSTLLRFVVCFSLFL